MTNRPTLHRSISRYALLACASGIVACSGDYALGDLSSQDQQLEGSATDPAPEPADTTVTAALRLPDVTFGIETLFSPSMLATADIDGDGFDDFAMGELDFDTLTQFVHIRYGGPRPAEGEAFGSQLGDFTLGESGARLLLDSFDVPLEGVASAGDIDGDGYADLIVAMARCAPTQANEGVYLLYGGPERLIDLTPLDEVGVQLVRPPVASTRPEGNIGCGSNASAIAGVGDLDGDGLDDFVLADAPERELDTFADENGDGSAEAYLFYGRAERLEDGTPWTDADATLVSGFDLQLAPAGDIDADGLSDLFLGSNSFAGIADYPRGLVLLRGDSARLSGAIDVGAVTQRIEGATIEFTAPYPATADLDGDGISDVFLRDQEQDLHVFYGGPGLFEDGVDLASSAAVIPASLGLVRVFVSAGDLDGDGDADLITHFSEERPDFPFASDVAQLSGSSARRAGEIDFPFDEVKAARPLGMFGDAGRALDLVLPGGDLDGDGADDLISVSTVYTPLDDQGGFRSDQTQLHIHYGTPGGTSAEPLR